MSNPHRTRSNGARPCGRAALVLALWLILGFVLALAAPKAANDLTNFAAGPELPATASTLVPI